MRPLPSPSLLVAVAAVLIASGGSAVAATLITSKQIKNGTIKLEDVSAGARKSLKGAAGPTGPAGPAGAPGSARAYASVIPSDPPVLNTQFTKNFVAVTGTGGIGTYCLTPAAGVDVSNLPAVTTVDEFHTKAPEGNAAALWAPPAAHLCRPGSVTVRTTRRTATGDAVGSSTVGFVVMVP